MSTEQKFEKVVYERWSNDKYLGRWVYTRDGLLFGVSDVPALFESRPYRNQEVGKTEYMYRKSEEGLHIALFYGGLPGSKSGEA